MCTTGTRRVKHKHQVLYFCLVQPVQTLTNKRFKLGAPTTFLTRSLANHGHIE